MASRKSSQHKVAEAQAFLLKQLEEARKRLQTLEKDLVKRGRTQQREIEKLMQRITSGRELKAFEKKASAASGRLVKQLQKAQSQALDALGLATQSQIRQLSREVGKLSKRIDAISKKPASSLPSLPARTVN